MTRQGGAGKQGEPAEERKGGAGKQQHHMKKGVRSHIPSEEPGFTGEPTEWFDDIQFKKQLI